MRKELILFAAAMLFSLLAGAQNTEVLDVTRAKDGSYVNTQGNFLIEGQVKNGLKEGTWYEIFPDKMLIHRVIQFEKGVMNGLYMEVDETGSLVKKAEYANGKLNGACYTWFRGGRLSGKNTYKDDVLEGEQIKCYDQGGNQEVSEYKNGLRDGLTTWFDQEGNKVMSIEYKKGLFEGKQETFYKNGVLKSVKQYKDNVQDGPASEYYESGALKSESNYKKGELSGKVKTYEDKPVEMEKKPAKEADFKKESKRADMDLKKADVRQLNRKQ